jgi:hypothetical protein
MRRKFEPVPRQFRDQPYWLEWMATSSGVSIRWSAGDFTAKLRKSWTDAGDCLRRLFRFFAWHPEALVGARYRTIATRGGRLRCSPVRASQSRSRRSARIVPPRAGLREVVRLARGACDKSAAIRAGSALCSVHAPWRSDRNELRLFRLEIQNWIYRSLPAAPARP